MIHFRYFWMIPVLALTCVSCATKPSGEDDGSADMADSTEAPRRANLPSYNSTGVAHGALEAIVFPDAEWKVPASEQAKIKAAATLLKVRAQRVVLAGGAQVSSPEYARQLGQQRAMAVREKLIDQGIPPNKITVVSYGLDLPGKSGDRVEFGIVPTGETAF